MEAEKTGKIILEKRKEKNLTQKDLANKINVSDKTVSKWERGRGCPDISLLIPLSKELDISIYKLLGGEEMEEKSVDKVIKNTIDITSKKLKRQKILDYTIIGLCSLILISIILFWLFINFHYLITHKPKNVSQKDLVFFNNYLKENNCTLTLDNQICEGKDGTAKVISSMEYDLKLPMWQVTKTHYGFKVDKEENKIIFNVGGNTLLEKEVNKYRFDKLYTKKSMIINSIVLFTFIQDLELIEYNFKDNTYLLNRDTFNNILSDDLFNNWKDKVIDNLSNKEFLNSFLK